MSLEKTSEALFGNERVSEEMWSIAYTLLGLGIAMPIVGFIGVWRIGGAIGYLSFAIMLIGAGSLWLGTLMLEKGQKNIPSDPASVAILTIWGRRIAVILREGMKMIFPWWPLRIDFTVIRIVRPDFDWVYEDVRCKAPVDMLADADGPTSSTATGGAATVSVSVTLTPDVDHPRRMISFLNNGGMDGVSKKYQDALGEGIRHVALLYDVDEFQTLKAELVVALIVKTTDADLHILPRQPDGTISAETFKISPADYKKLPRVDPYDYFFHPQDPKDRAQDVEGMSKEEVEAHDAKKKKCRTQEVEVFLRVSRENGVSDIIDLGVIITRLNVKKIVPEGGLEEVADEAAREKKQREGENWDFDTELQLAGKYIAFEEKHGKEAANAALERVRINRGRAREVIVRSSGNNFLDAAAAMEQTKG